MTKLVFCMNCGECLGKDRVNVAREHLKKFPNHISYLTKNIIDPFSLDNLDNWINRKFTGDGIHRRLYRALKQYSYKVLVPYYTVW